MARQIFHRICRSNVKREPWLRLHVSYDRIYSKWISLRGAKGSSLNPFTKLEPSSSSLYPWNIYAVRMIILFLFYLIYARTARKKGASSALDDI